MDTLEIGAITECVYDAATDQTPLHTPGTEISAFNFSASWYTVETYGERFRTVQIAHASHVHQRRSFIRYKHDDVWSSWRELAFAEPPQIYDLPLAEGFAPYEDKKPWQCSYCRDAFGFVHVNSRLVSSVEIARGMLLATLPEGYRPSFPLSVPCILHYSGDNEAQVGYVDVVPNGNICLWSPTRTGLIPFLIVISPFSFIP